MGNVLYLNTKTPKLYISMKYIVLDTETTGVPPREEGFDSYPDPQQYDIHYKDCRLVELGYVVNNTDDSKQDVEISRYDRIVKPINFTINNSDFHHITTEIATAKGESLSAVLNQLTVDLESCSIIVGHNINFDIHILLAEAYRTGNDKLVNLLISKEQFCTMTHGKNRMKTKKSPKLTELYKFLYNKPLDQSHRALLDVIATIQCYNKLK